MFSNHLSHSQYRISSQFVNTGVVTTRGLMVKHIPSSKVSNNIHCTVWLILVLILGTWGDTATLFRMAWSWHSWWCTTIHRYMSMLYAKFYFPLSTDFINELRSIRKRFDPLSPTVVHCSAGVGRSGVVVLTEMLMDRVDIGEVRVGTATVSCFIYSYRLLISPVV